MRHPRRTFVTNITKSVWKTTFVLHWCRAQDINVFEATTAELSAEWLASKKVRNKKDLILTNSLVTVNALRKERSSSPTLALICRRFACITLAHHITPLFANILSHHNPADAPSLPNTTMKATHRRWQNMAQVTAFKSEHTG